MTISGCSWLRRERLMQLPRRHHPFEPRTRRPLDRRHPEASPEQPPRPLPSPRRSQSPLPRHSPPGSHGPYGGFSCVVYSISARPPHSVVLFLRVSCVWWTCRGNPDGFRSNSWRPPMSGERTSIKSANCGGGARTVRLCPETRKSEPRGTALYIRTVSYTH